MAKSKYITKNVNHYIWKWRSFKNWFYDKWMQFKGYTPITFNFYDNKYNYEKRSDIDKCIENETEPEFEQIHYDAPDKWRGISWTNTHNRNEKLKELRKNA